MSTSLVYPHSHIDIHKYTHTETQIELTFINPRRDRPKGYKLITMFTLDLNSKHSPTDGTSSARLQERGQVLKVNLGLIHVRGLKGQTNSKVHHSESSSTRIIPHFEKVAPDDTEHVESLMPMHSTPKFTVGSSYYSRSAQATRTEKQHHRT